MKVKSHHIAAWLLFLTIVGGYALMAMKFPLAYIIATYEDLVGEWAQVFMFAITMVLAGRQALVSPRFRLYFSVLALACFYVVGEEISWGQRIFDVATPEFFQQHNLQKETNLHNLLTGPISTGIKRSIEYVIAVGLAVYGLLYPWLLQRHWSVARWFENKGLVAPPLYLWPFFVCSAVLELRLFGFNEAEVAELLIPLALGLMILNYWMAHRYQLDVQQQNGWSRLFCQRMTRATLTVVACVALLAVGTTTLSYYSSPRLAGMIEERFWNGVEKFAGRYKRVDQWETSVHLYTLMLAEEPHRASLRRQLFRCYIQLENKAVARSYLDEAITVDMKRLEKNPQSVSANISMARNCILMENDTMVDQYLNRALALGFATKKSDPEDDRAAYWLGKALKLRGDLVEACLEFQRATVLRPHSMKYRKALIQVREQLTLVQF